jgi:hypothetical protein
MLCSISFWVNVVVVHTTTAAELLQQATVSSYENNCPIQTTGSKRGIHWWRPHLESLYHEITGLDCLLIGIKKAQGRYVRANRCSKQEI